MGVRWAWAIMWLGGESLVALACGAAILDLGVLGAGLTGFALLSGWALSRRSGATAGLEAFVGQ
ncbi:MAG: hypothetical protein AB7W37_01825 [Syntrophobacteraceae bacterium]